VEQGLTIVAAILVEVITTILYFYYYYWVHFAANKSHRHLPMAFLLSRKIKSVLLSKSSNTNGLEYIFSINSKK
jgi:hypothetical protein